MTSLFNYVDFIIVFFNTKTTKFYTKLTKFMPIILNHTKLCGLPPKAVFVAVFV